MFALLLLFAGLPVPFAPPLAEQVDVIEVNHFHDDKGVEIFVQVIFWERIGKYGTLIVRDWRLVKDFKQTDDGLDKQAAGPLMPRKDHKRGIYVCLWHDKDVLRKVAAMTAVETYTQVDPELVNREIWPKERRTLLLPSGNKKPEPPTPPPLFIPGLFQPR